MNAERNEADSALQDGGSGWLPETGLGPQRDLHMYRPLLYACTR